MGVWEVHTGSEERTMRGLRVVVLADICSLSFCQCEDSDVSCQGEDKEDLKLSPSFLPSSISSLTLSNLASLTIMTNTFSDQEDLKELHLSNIGNVVLEKFCYSYSELSGHITHLNLVNISMVDLQSANTFDNFPQISHVVIKKVGMKIVPTGGLKLYSDTMLIEECNIGEIHRESIYSDSQTFVFINNKVKIIKTQAISGSNNNFNFSGNDVSKIESNSISVAFLSGDLSRNIFHSHTGTPLRDVGPEPVCMPDQAAYSYEDPVEYKIVATPTFIFEGNYFPQFSLAVLNLPGAQNVPLGSLTIGANKVPCDCMAIQELAVLADFDHLQDNEMQHEEFGDLVFKKEFYSRALCVGENEEEMRLKKFARSWLEITETEVKCTNPKQRKQKQAKYNIINGDKRESSMKNDVLADEPHSEKVEAKSEKKSAPPLPSPTSQEESNSSNDKNCMAVIAVSILFLLHS